MKTASMAASLSLPLPVFLAQNTDAAILDGSGSSFRRLRSSPTGCSLLTEQNTCSGYSGRPLQCRTYPFWPRILASEYTWSAEENVCPGISTSSVLPSSRISLSKAKDEAARWEAWLRRFNFSSVAQLASTHKWASDFVEPLSLCPWASASLAAPGAIKYFVSSATDTRDAFEVLNCAAAELILADGDPNKAITFCVFPSFKADSFESFHAFFCDLEENHVDHDVTLAGFHPGWLWDLPQDSPLHYEKRSPFPTISLVHTRGIEGENAETKTERIAEQNLKTLTDLGSDALALRFKRFIEK